MASSLVPDETQLQGEVGEGTAVRDSTYFFEQERLVKMELLCLAQRQRSLQWTAQLYARRAKQLWTEEKLKELGVPHGQRKELLDGSQEELASEPATAAEAPAPSGGAKRKEAAFSQPADDVQKKRLREKPPPDVPCVACWNLGRGKAQGVRHDPEKCSKSRFYNGKKAAIVPKAEVGDAAAGGAAAEPAEEVVDAAAEGAADEVIE